MIDLEPMTEKEIEAINMFLEYTKKTLEKWHENGPNGVPPFRTQHKTANLTINFFIERHNEKVCTCIGTGGCTCNTLSNHTGLA